MGTYVVNTWFSLDANTGTFRADPILGTCSSADADILSALSHQSTAGLAVFNQHFCDGVTPCPANGLIRASTLLTNNAISLDGNPAISFFGLPAGFQLTSEVFSIFLRGNLSFGAGGHHFLQFNPLTESVSLPLDTVPAGGLTYSFSNPDLPFVSALDLLGDGAGWRYDTAPSFFFPSMEAWQITGSYVIISASITPSSVSSHTPVTLTGSSLDTITGITIVGSGGAIGSGIITSITPTTVKFTMPSLGLATGAGMLVFEFSGFAPFMLPITIILADPSGLYELIPGKTADTLYVDHSTGTMDVAIPNPFIKTGFING